MNNDWSKPLLPFQRLTFACHSLQCSPSAFPAATQPCYQWHMLKASHPASVCIHSLQTGVVDICQKIKKNKPVWHGVKSVFILKQLWTEKTRMISVKSTYKGWLHMRVKKKSCFELRRKSGPWQQLCKKLRGFFRLTVTDMQTKTRDAWPHVQMLFQARQMLVRE